MGRPIAFLAPRFAPDGGGLALAAARLARSLARHLPVEVLTPTTALAGTVSRAEEDDLVVLRYGATSREDAQRRGFELLTSRGPYRLVHGVYVSEMGFLAAYAARYLNIACLVAARGNDLDRDAFRPERQAGVLYALSHATAAVGVSRALTRQAEALGASRALWIPNGVDPRRFAPRERDGALAEALALEGAFPVVGFFGEARLKKGLPTLLAAFRALHRRRPEARLLLVGGVREGDRPLLAVFAEQNPLTAEAIVEVGPVAQDELASYYALCDLLWHPSYQDGCPNAVLEGLACGRLTVGTTVGGMPDLLAELGGLLVAPRDAEALVEATEALLADEPARRALERRGRAVAERFSPEAEVRAYLALYETLAPSSS